VHSSQKNYYCFFAKHSSLTHPRLHKKCREKSEFPLKSLVTCASNLYSSSSWLRCCFSLSFPMEKWPYTEISVMIRYFEIILRQINNNTGRTAFKKKESNQCFATDWLTKNKTHTLRIPASLAFILSCIFSWFHLKGKGKGIKVTHVKTEMY